MWESYYTVASIDDALNILANEKEKARIIAGGTDLVLELKNGLHENVRTLIDITRVKDIEKIEVDDDYVYIYPGVTHNQILVSKAIQKFGIPLLKACQSIGAAQIRNIGTVVGNIVTASPANDTISPLIALESELLIRSNKSERWVFLNDFYTGVRKTVLKKDEMVACLRFKKMQAAQKAFFSKYLLRKAHGISVVNVSGVLNFSDGKILDARIALGAVAPTVIRASKTEIFLTGKILDKDTIEKVKNIVKSDSQPITDIRGSIDYRQHLSAVLLSKGLKALVEGTWDEYQESPVLLWGNAKAKNNSIKKTILHDKHHRIESSINGKLYDFNAGQTNTLLKLVREQAHLTGTKLGCGEGECGACTMHLDGLPVLSCLVPAPKAQGAELTTIEGLISEGNLHPIQQAFIDEGAVQCGYCTPGFIMSAAKLLEEKPDPTILEIREGLAGNICRCTGYYSIISAVERAATEMYEF